jgi:hypothetical protein
MPAIARRITTNLGEKTCMFRISTHAEAPGNEQPPGDGS